MTTTRLLSNASLLNPLPIANGGTGTNLRFGKQSNFPSSISVSNLLGTSRTITNARIYSFATGSAYNYSLTSPAFYSVIAGVPAVSKQSGFIYSKVPTVGNYNGGYYSIEFVVHAAQMDIAMKGLGGFSSFSTIDVDIDGSPAITVAGQANKTAQAGGASTITLAAGSSATSGVYNQEYIYIVGGTGAGQRRKITAYNGSTLVATVDSAWSTQPDSTSIYIISPTENTVMGVGDYSTYYPTITFSGAVRPHVVRITASMFGILSIGVDSSGTIWPSASSFKPTMVVVGDSYVGGFQGAAPGSINSIYGAILCKNFDANCQLQGIGATGIVATNSGANLNYAQRTTPPVNSWQMSTGNATGGTFTLTQGGTTTAPVAYSASPAVLQSALNTAFGANEFIVRYATMPLDGDYFFVIENVGANTASTAEMTLNAGSLTGTSWTPSIVRYVGDIDPVVPRDSSGVALPFTIIVQGSVNDIGSYASLQTAASSYFVALQARFPTATILVTGIPMKRGPVPNTSHELDAQAALYNAVVASLPKINGRVPWLATYDWVTGVGYLNGNTTVASPSGVAGDSTDILMCQDALHPTTYGHMLFGNILTQEAVAIMKK